MEDRACAFTGHRTVKRDHLSELSPLLDRAIAYAYGEGVRRFLCGGAKGFDTEAALAVLSFRREHPDVKLCLILPCTDQTSGWSEDQIRLYEHILEEADSAEFMSVEYTDDCMRRRNQRLVDESDMLIAYLGHDNSGAAQTVRMARRAAIPVYNLYPTLDKK